LPDLLQRKAYVQVQTIGDAYVILAGLEFVGEQNTGMETRFESAQRKRLSKPSGRDSKYTAGKQLMSMARRMLQTVKVVLISFAISFRFKCVAAL
jgi:hypothetical protein